MGRGRKRSRDPQSATCECAGGPRDDQEAGPAGSSHQQELVVRKGQSRAQHSLRAEQGAASLETLGPRQPRGALALVLT